MVGTEYILSQILKIIKLINRKCSFLLTGWMVTWSLKSNAEVKNLVKMTKTKLRYQWKRKDNRKSVKLRKIDRF